MDGETIYSVYDHSGQLVFRDNATTGEETDYISAAGMSIVRVTNDVPTWIASDHLGSASKGLDSSGNVIWEERYSPYGERLMQPAANDNHTGFTGHVEDAATGLTYMQARYYDPVIGRFLSTDPVQFVPDRPDMFNRYAYAANDPVNMIDPDGNQPASVMDRRAVTGSTEMRRNPESALALSKTVLGQANDNLNPLADAGAFVQNPTVEYAVIAAAGALPGPNVAKHAKRSSDQKAALVDMARQDKRTGGITEGDMEAYKDLNAELSDPFPEDAVRGPEAHPGRGHGSKPHGHVGPVGHIPIKPDEPE